LYQFTTKIILISQLKVFPGAENVQKNSFVIERTRKDTSNVVDVDLNSGFVFFGLEKKKNHLNYSSQVLQAWAFGLCK
jgi:hypothetical protein